MAFAQTSSPRSPGGGTLAHAQRPQRASGSPLNLLRQQMLCTDTSPKSKLRVSSSMPALPKQRNVLLELADASLMTAHAPGPRDVPEFTTQLLTNRVACLMRERDKVRALRASLDETLQRSEQYQTTASVLAHARQISDVNQTLQDYRQSLKQAERDDLEVCRARKQWVRETRAQVGADCRLERSIKLAEITQNSKADVASRTLHNHQQSAELAQTISSKKMQIVLERSIDAAKRRDKKLAAEEIIIGDRERELARLRSERDILKGIEEAAATRLQEKRLIQEEVHRTQYRNSRMEQFVSKEKAQVIAKKAEKAQLDNLEVLREEFDRKRELQLTLNKTLAIKTELVRMMKEALAAGDTKSLEEMKLCLAGSVFDAGTTSRWPYARAKKSSTESLPSPSRTTANPTCDTPSSAATEDSVVLAVRLDFQTQEL